MNRQAYKAARALIRANGSYALRWLEPAQRDAFESLGSLDDDTLSYRARTERGALLRIALYPQGPRTDAMARRMFATRRSA